MTNVIDLKTVRDLEEYLDKNLGGCSVEVDYEGQVVIYTGVRATPTGRLKAI